MIRPRPALILALAALATLAILQGVVGFAMGWIWGPALILLAVMLIDGALALSLVRLTASREVASEQPVGETSTVQLRLNNPHRWPVHVTLLDHHPEGQEIHGLPLAAWLPAKRGASVHYAIRWMERGQFTFGPVELIIRSPLRLFERRCRLPSAQSVRVFPDFARVQRYQIIATDNRLSQMGMIKRRRRGEGLEFHQLREYRQGDALRSIDWKASSRQQKLISRDYQDERDQQILLVLDASRRLRAREPGQLGHFDEALNAALLLAWTALRQGDAVGAYVPGDNPRWLAPAKSGAQFNRLLNGLFDIQANAVASDFIGMAEFIAAHQTKRALIIVLTSLRDEDADTLLPAVQLLRRRHLVTVASLRESALDEVLQQRIKTFDDAIRVAATSRYLESQHQFLEQLRAQKLAVLDCLPDALAPALVNHYWQLKAAGQL